MLFYHPDLSEASITLSPEESGHIVRVLRLSSGDPIEISDGKGTIAQAKIKVPDSRKCTVEIIDRNVALHPPIPLHIAVSPTKNIDRISWFVEKAVEIGIMKISFPICNRSERKTLNIDKLILKAINAMKQSKGAFLPELAEPIPLDLFLKSTHGETKKFIAHLQDDQTPDLIKSAQKDQSYLVLIGPEGDFTEEEIGQAIKSGYQVVKMGTKRLRTETAALHACSMINSLHYS